MGDTPITFIRQVTNFLIWSQEDYKIFYFLMNLHLIHKSATTVIVAQDPMDELHDIKSIQSWEL